MNIRYTLKYTTLIQFQKARAHTPREGQWERRDTQIYIWKFMCTFNSKRVDSNLKHTHAEHNFICTHSHTVTVTNKIKLWSAAHKVHIHIHFGILLSSLKVCANFFLALVRARSEVLPLISVESYNCINHSFLAICSHIWMPRELIYGVCASVSLPVLEKIAAGQQQKQ